MGGLELCVYIGTRCFVRLRLGILFLQSHIPRQLQTRIRAEIHSPFDTSFFHNPPSEGNYMLSRTPFFSSPPGLKN